MKHLRTPIIESVVPSTVIRHFHYDATDKRLDVQFVSGRRYSYFNVPEELAVDMANASSKGSFFNRHM